MKPLTPRKWDGILSLVWFCGGYLVLRFAGLRLSFPGLGNFIIFGAWWGVAMLLAISGLRSRSWPSVVTGLGTVLLFIWLFLIGTPAYYSYREGGAGGSTSTNLSIVVWSSLPPTTNSYRHIEHLQELLKEANALMATNPAVFSQFGARGRLADNSPLRGLLGIPVGESAYVTGWQSIAQRCVIISSSKTEQRFGRIKVNLGTGLIDSAYDVEALFVISEMERRLRQTVGTREEALRLFRGGLPDSPSPEQERATRALAAALFLPKDTKCYVQMSAPGGSNGGQGYLRVDVVSSSNPFEHVARVTYPIRHSLFSAFGLLRPSYRFGGLTLSPAWTNLNTAGFLIDSEGFPYPRQKGP